MENIEFEKVMVQPKGKELVPLNELPREEYECFLEKMHIIRSVYIAITTRENGKTKNNQK